MTAIPLLDEKFDGTPATFSPVAIHPKGDRTRRVMMVATRRRRGAILNTSPSLGRACCSYPAPLAQWDGPYVYERDIWFEDRLGRMDPDKDLDGVDVLMITAFDQRDAAGLRTGPPGPWVPPEPRYFGRRSPNEPAGRRGFRPGRFRRDRESRRRRHNRSTLRHPADVARRPQVPVPGASRRDHVHARRQRGGDATQGIGRARLR